MKFIKRLWWLLADRHIEWEAPEGFPSSERVGFSEGWALIRPYWHYRWLVDMPCGCQRFPWKRRPTTMRLRCELHSIFASVVDEETE